jgi:uncharacterized membrane protein YedE/YeeE
MKTLTALIAGLLFGAGLVLSGMTDPANVLGFLDIGGDWNPALAFTMASAILVAAPAFFYARRREARVAGDLATKPAAMRITAPLIIGSIVFGLGWGLTGICPGPGLILLTTLTPGAFVFVACMLAGMVAATRFRP